MKDKLSQEYLEKFEALKTKLDCGDCDLIELLIDSYLSSQANTGTVECDFYASVIPSTADMVRYGIDPYRGLY